MYFKHVKVKVAQSCLTLRNPMHYTVHGILQARILEWVAFPFSRGSSQSRDQTQVSCLQADSLPAEPQGKSLSHAQFFHDPVGCSLLGSSVHGISQARILVWVSISFFMGSSQPRDQTQVSCIAGRFFTS